MQGLETIYIINRARISYFLYYTTQRNTYFSDVICIGEGIWFVICAGEGIFKGTIGCVFDLHVGFQCWLFSIEKQIRKIA